MSTTATNGPQLPVYFDSMIDAFEHGHMGRHAHLGHWPDSPAATTDSVAEDDLLAGQGRLNTRMIQLAHMQNGQRILDIGCGFGGLIQQIDRQFREMDITGTNIDPRQLEICHRLRSAGGNALRWQEADACDLPFASATFDVVFCIEAMFHFSSRSQFLAETGRILKPGGVLVATDIVLTNDAGLTDNLPQFCIEALLNDGYGPWPDPWCRQGTAAEILTNDGWSDVTVTDATQNTLPSYQYIVSDKWSDQHDPVDAAARSALMLRWLHTNGHLRYEYISARRYT